LNLVYLCQKNDGFSLKKKKKKQKQKQKVMMTKWSIDELFNRT